MNLQMPAPEPASKLRSLGYCVLPTAFSASEIDFMRQAVVANQERMPNTRSAAHSRHLAGFERFSQFEGLHATVNENSVLNAFFDKYFEGQDFGPFGLSDITVNRSQQWHSDLLRSKYAVYLDSLDPWSESAGACIKALVYLQDGKSLKVVPGSHKSATPLDDTEIERLVASREVHEISVAAGDIVMMDIRCLHRGSTDQEMSDVRLSKEPKILVSNVYATLSSALGIAMRIGNSHRMKDWDVRHLHDGQLQPQ